MLASFCMLTVAAEKKPTGTKKGATAGTKIASSAVKATNDSATEGSGRLPPHFASLVDAKQRSEIYQIQLSYHEKKQELQAALAALELAQLSDIEQVLTSTQRKKLSDLRKGGSAMTSTKSAASPKAAAKTKSAVSSKSAASPKAASKAKSAASTKSAASPKAAAKAKSAASTKSAASPKAAAKAKSAAKPKSSSTKGASTKSTAGDPSSTSASRKGTSE